MPTPRKEGGIVKHMNLWMTTWRTRTSEMSLTHHSARGVHERALAIFDRKSRASEQGDPLVGGKNL